MISFEEFKNLDLRVANIKKVENHPNADKLYVITIEVGNEEKQIVAGIKLQYAKGELIGKQIIVVNNLQPVVLRGIESRGMLLAAQENDLIAILVPDRPVASGSPIR